MFFFSLDFQSKKSMISADDLFKANKPLSSINSTNIYSGLTNQSLPGVEMTNEQNSIHSSDRMARKERKLHDQWFSSTKADSPNKKTNLFDIEFTPIAVLRRKFLDKTTENQQVRLLFVFTRKCFRFLSSLYKINSSTTTKTINPCQTNQFPSNGEQSISIIHIFDESTNRESKVKHLSVKALEHLLRRTCIHKDALKQGREKSAFLSRSLVRVRSIVRCH